MIIIVVQVIVDQISASEFFKDSNIDQFLPFGTSYRGVLENNMEFARTVGYLDSVSRVLFVHIDVMPEGLTLVMGETLENIPTGDFQYNGFNGLIDNSNLRTSYEYGTFNMSVDFSIGWGTISASTANSQLVGSYIVDTDDGSIFGSDLTLTINNSRSKSSSFYGSFHGDGATTVSGVYHENEPNPEYQGVIVGTDVRLRTN